MCVLYVCDIFVLISVGGLSTEQSHCLPGLPTVSETKGFKQISTSLISHNY